MKKINNSLNNTFLFVFHFILVFCFIVELPLFAVFTTRRLAVLYAFAYLIINNGKVRSVLKYITFENIRSFGIYFALLILISLINSAYLRTNDRILYMEPWYFVYMILYICIFSLYCATAFRNIKTFTTVLVANMLVQTVTVFYSFINPTFQIEVYMFFNTEDQRLLQTVENGSRVVGMGLSGALGSVVISTAAVLLVLMRIKNKIPVGPFYLLYFVVFITTLFIGRTGLLVEALLLIWLVIRGKNGTRNALGIGLLAILIPVIVQSVMATLTFGAAESYSDWMMEIFSADKLRDINQGVVQGGWPPFTPQMIFGTGIEAGYMYNGIRYASDSGFIRMYTAVGLVGMFLYYMGLYKLLRAPRIFALKPILKKYFLLVILISFVIEYKEPFMMKYVFPWVILTSQILVLKEDCKCQKMKA